MNLLQSCTAFIRAHRLFEPRDRLLVACSGGADSVALSYVLAELGYAFDLAHCNFQLRGAESDADATFVEQLGADLGVEVHQTRFETAEIADRTPGASLQMVARRLRYDWLESVRQRSAYDYLLTAHHLDDSLETFLFNFSRGASLRGLRGIPAVHGHIRRPLLCVDRTAIEAFLAGNELAYRTDSSNASPKYVRNRIRHHLVPELRNLNPDLSQTVADNLEQLQQAWLMVERFSEMQREQLVESIDSHTWQIDRARLQDLAFGKYMLFLWLEPLGFSSEQVRQALEARVGTWLTTQTHQLLVQHGHLLVRRLEERAVDTLLLQRADRQMLISEEERLYWKEENRSAQSLTTAPRIATFDADRIQWPLRLRRWRAGDRFQPFGMEGRSRKLQDFFTDQKIDRLARDRCWILENGNGEIIWLVGYRIDHRYRVRETTSRLLRMEHQFNS